MTAPFWEAPGYFRAFNPSINVCRHDFPYSGFDSHSDFIQKRDNVFAASNAIACATDIYLSVNVDFGLRKKVFSEIRYVIIDRNQNTRSPNTFNIEYVPISIDLAHNDNFFQTYNYTAKITLHSSNMSTCSTGNVLVNLGMLQQNDLPPVGNAVASKPFDIQLTNCPRINIGYSFVAPVNVDSDDATGVVDLDSTATAQGIGIQISHRNDPVYNNDTIVYNPSYATPSYTSNWPLCQSQGTCTVNQNTSVNHTIPMQAAVYRKDNVVVPGKINASVLFHIVYP